MDEYTTGNICNPLLVMNGISKQFPGVLALKDVDLELYPGEIVGLIGENGAGKSTLMRCLGGIHAPDTGTICVNGKSVAIDNVEAALALGISIIHQELNLAGNLDIASNIFLGREPSIAPFGVVRRDVLYKNAAKLASRVGITKPMTTVVDDLSTGEQQLVEIVKAMSMSAKILVLDEPTSSLSPGEAERLFQVMTELKAAGVAMIYISHRLGEIERMCDRVVTLRDGERVGELKREEISRDSMVRLMVGRDISRFFPEVNEHNDLGEPVLSVTKLCRRGSQWSYTFNAYPGEILGFAGLVGAGRSELMSCLFGVDPAVSGTIAINGSPVRIRSAGDAIQAGIGFVPEDRKALGIILSMAVKENITLPGIKTYHSLLLRPKREHQVAKEQATSLAVKTPSLDQEVQFLSGGNQQKVALAKWLALDPKVLILDEPTRGIDVGSKSEIYRLVRELADSGVAIIMVSSDMEEVIGLADRVIVMHENRITGETPRSEMTEEKIMQLAIGGCAQ